MERIRVILIEDHALVRQGIRIMLELDEEITVMGEAATGERGLTLADTFDPHVAIVDMRLPEMDGVEVTRRIKENHPDTEVLVLTSYGEEYLGPAIEAGASGYLLKTATRGELVSAIKAVHRGQSPIDPSLGRHLFASLAGPVQARHLSDLSARELQVLRLIASGAMTREMATQLGVSDRTVTRELRDIYDKLGVNDRAHAVSEAYKRRLL